MLAAVAWHHQHTLPAIITNTLHSKNSNNNNWIYNSSNSHSHSITAPITLIRWTIAANNTQPVYAIPNVIRVGVTVVMMAPQPFPTCVHARIAHAQRRVVNSMPNSWRKQSPARQCMWKVVVAKTPLAVWIRCPHRRARRVATTVLGKWLLIQ